MKKHLVIIIAIFSFTTGKLWAQEGDKPALKAAVAVKGRPVQPVDSTWHAKLAVFDVRRNSTDTLHTTKSDADKEALKHSMDAGFKGRKEGE